MGELFVGTSGFAYREWKPAFYPPDIGQKKFLEYYASQFRAVEIDQTFYRMPTAKTLANWRDATPSSFRFALKASRRITHWERLRVPSDTLEYLLETLPYLEERLGTVLYQLPPNFKRDVERLELFLGSLRVEIPTAFEFRHESWFTDEVYALLENHGAALCIHDADDQTTPIRLTSERTYVRLRKARYSPDVRRQWQDRFRKWMSDGRDVYAFVKHEDNPDAPQVAREFAEGM